MYKSVIDEFSYQQFNKGYLDLGTEFEKCDKLMQDKIDNITDSLRDHGLEKIYVDECRPEGAYEALVEVIMVCTLLLFFLITVI